MESTKIKQEKEIAAHEEQLPWELIEEILSRVSPKSLVHFRIVCKRWKAIIDDKTFINNHKETFRFILVTKSKIYSVSIDPKIVMRELTLDIPGLGSQIPKTLSACDEFLLCNMDEGAAVWNPWLKLSTWINQPKTRFGLQGICYNNSNTRSEEKVYKTIWYHYTGWIIHDYDFASGMWKDVKLKYHHSNHERVAIIHSKSAASLNGTLFWIYFSDEKDPLYGLSCFDFSNERFHRFCYLPCGISHSCDALVLRVFKGDRFSVLKQCQITKKIDIWVTKNKVNVEVCDDVVWMNFMTFSIPNFPGLAHDFNYEEPSYFMDDKRLVVCSCDEVGKVWIYVLGENKLISKVQLDSVVDPWPLHCTYFPNLVPVPRGQRYNILPVFLVFFFVATRDFAHFYFGEINDF